MSPKTKKLVWAISLVFLIALACIGALIYFNTKPLVASSPNNENKPISKTLGNFQSIDGTNYLIASVTSNNSEASVFSELFSSGRWYGGGSGYSQYNLVFLDVTSETVYPLLPTNDNEIVSMEGFPKPVPSFTNQSQPPQPAHPIAWWLFSIVASDTNQDNNLSALDKQTISVSDVGGKGYAEIISNVDNLLGTAYKNTNTLLVIYRSDGKNYLAHVDLPSRQVTSTEELPLGGEIK